jgi:hypothetical protein
MSGSHGKHVGQDGEKIGHLSTDRGASLGVTRT